MGYDRVKQKHFPASKPPSLPRGPLDTGPDRASRSIITQFLYYTKRMLARISFLKGVASSTPRRRPRGCGARHGDVRLDERNSASLGVRPRAVSPRIVSTSHSGASTTFQSCQSLATRPASVAIRLSSGECRKWVNLTEKSPL